jgi:DNA-binding beta-propeller fold protein YncE
VLGTNTVFVGNRDDLTVSVIDGSTCNANNTSGCAQTPPAVLLGAFPNAQSGYALARGITVDPLKQVVYITNFGDSDVATLDASICRAGHVEDCQAKIVHKRMGGFPVMATVVDSSNTVYVPNNNDGTVSLFSDENLSGN